MIKLSTPRRALVTATIMVSCVGSGGAQNTRKADLVNKESAKNSNIAEAQKLNGDQPVAKNRVDKEDASKKEAGKPYANIINQVPGVKVSQKDLEPDQPAIHGFHPIKKLMRPINNLEGTADQLERETLKLEGPITGLGAPMQQLDKKMVSVDHNLGTLQTGLTGMSHQVTGARSDVAKIRDTIDDLRKPICRLKKPVDAIAGPVEHVQTQLNLILLAIMIFTVAICVGTPLAAILIYKHRDKFLHPSDQRHLENLATEDSR